MKKVFLLISLMSISLNNYAQQVNPCDSIRIEPFTINGKKGDDRSKNLTDLVFYYVRATNYCNIVNLEDYSDILVHREINSSTNNTRNKVDKSILNATKLLKGDLGIVGFGDCRLKLSITDIVKGKALSGEDILIPKNILINEDMLRDTIKKYVHSLVSYNNVLNNEDIATLKTQNETQQKQIEIQQKQIETLQKQIDDIKVEIKKVGTNSKLSIDAKERKIIKILVDNNEILHEYLIQKYPYGYKTFVFSNSNINPISNIYENEMRIKVDWQNTKIQINELTKEVKIKSLNWLDTLRNISVRNITYIREIPKIGTSVLASPYYQSGGPNPYIENLSQPNKSTIVLVIGFK